MSRELGVNPGSLSKAKSSTRGIFSRYSGKLYFCVSGSRSQWTPSLFLGQDVRVLAQCRSIPPQYLVQTVRQLGNVLLPRLLHIYDPPQLISRPATLVFTEAIYLSKVERTGRATFPVRQRQSVYRLLAASPFLLRACRDDDHKEFADKRTF